MNRLLSQRALPWMAAAGLCASAAFATWRQEGPAMEARPVAGKVQWIEGARGGNIGLLVGEEGALLIDTYIAGGREALATAVDAADGKGVRLVLNTHWHADHTGNNPVWGGAATVLAHENVRTRLAASGATDAGLLPLVTYSDGIRLYLAGEEVVVRHYAQAHTDGDSAVFFPESKVVHLGDLFFNKRFPYIDLGSGGGVRGLMAAVEEILPELDESWTIIPGHGPLAKKADLEQYLAMLREASARVQTGLDAKQSLAQLEAADVLAPWKEWSWAFIDSKRFLTILFESLSSGR